MKLIIVIVSFVLAICYLLDTSSGEFYLVLVLVILLLVFKDTILVSS